MTDVQVDTAIDPDESPVVTITLPADCGTMDVDTSKFSIKDYKAIFIAGLEVMIMKSGMSKLRPGITRLEGKEREERTKQIREQAAKNLEAMYEGNLKGSKTKPKTSGAVQTEAMRLAKEMVKDMIRAANQKIGAYKPKELTEAAKQVLSDNPHLIKTAEENLASRVQDAKGVKKLDLKGLFGAKAESEEVKAKPRKPPVRKEKGEKAPISAAQAKTVAPRQKQIGATAH